MSEHRDEEENADGRHHDARIIDDGADSQQDRQADHRRTQQRDPSIGVLDSVQAEARRIERHPEHADDDERQHQSHPRLREDVDVHPDLAGQHTERLTADDRVEEPPEVRTLIGRAQPVEEQHGEHDETSDAHRQPQTFEREPDARRGQHEVGHSDDESRHGSELSPQTRCGEDDAGHEHGKSDDEDAMQRLGHQRRKPGDRQQQSTAVQRQRRVPDPIEPGSDEQRLTQQRRHLQLGPGDDVVGEHRDGHRGHEEHGPELVPPPRAEQRQHSEQQRPPRQRTEHRDVRVRRTLPRHGIDQIRRDRHRREHDTEAVRPGMNELPVVLPHEPRQPQQPDHEHGDDGEEPRRQIVLRLHRHLPVEHGLIARMPIGSMRPRSHRRTGRIVHLLGPGQSHERRRQIGHLHQAGLPR